MSKFSKLISSFILMFLTSCGGTHKENNLNIVDRDIFFEQMRNLIKEKSRQDSFDFKNLKLENLQALNDTFGLGISSASGDVPINNHLQARLQKNLLEEYNHILENHTKSK